ncbi:endonuclease, partial [Listeria monocytogenes]
AFYLLHNYMDFITYFVINDEEKTTIEIVDVIDIFNHADKIIPVVERYL